MVHFALCGYEKEAQHCTLFAQARIYSKTLHWRTFETAAMPLGLVLTVENKVEQDIGNFKISPETHMFLNGRLVFVFLQK